MTTTSKSLGISNPLAPGTPGVGAGDVQAYQEAVARAAADPVGDAASRVDADGAPPVAVSRAKWSVSPSDMKQVRVDEGDQRLEIAGPGTPIGNGVRLSEARRVGMLSDAPASQPAAFVKASGGMMLAFRKEGELQVLAMGKPSATPLASGITPTGDGGLTITSNNQSVVVPEEAFNLALSRITDTPA